MRLAQLTISLQLTQLALIVTLTLGVVAFWIAVRRSATRWLRRRQWLRAQGAEAAAPRLLESLGYHVLGAQVAKSYSLVVDGEPMNIALRADYLVARQGKTYVAEVKSGKWAPNLGTAATRRQLLEYLVAFQVDGVLLVNGETHRVHQVAYPVSLRTASQTSLGIAFGWTIVGLLAAALLWILYQW